MPVIPFGPFAPDLPSYSNPGLTVARNVIPRGTSYGPLGALSNQATALTGQCYGAGTAVDTGHNTFVYAGDRTKLYSMVAAAPVDVSKAGGYALAIDGNWEFTQFGRNYFVATDYDDAVQYIAPGGTIFADLIASSDKPKARHLGVVRQFLVLGNTNDATDGVQPSRVWWSAINTPTDFSPNAATQCDYEDLKIGGWVQRVVGNMEFGLIFQESQIVRMSYASPPVVWQFDAIDQRRGTPIPGSVVAHGRRVYFISDEGFFVTDGAGESVPIGQNLVDRYFWDQFDIAHRHRVTAAVDPVRKCVFWGFPGTGNTGGAPNLLLIYNWQDNKWSDAAVDHEILCAVFTQGYTLDQLDTVSSTLEALPYSLDSLAWTGGLSRLGAFDTSHRLSYFTGSNLAATLETGEVALAEGRRFLTRRIRPLVDGGTITAAVAGRDRLVDSASYGTAQAIETAGVVNLRAHARYQKFRTSIASAGSWTHAQGLEIEGRIMGDR